MVYRNYLKIILKIIAVLTIISGLVQMFVPDFVLGMIGGEITGSTLHFFGIIGMFMVMFGGLLLHALSGDRKLPVAVLWCGLQKFGAAVAVSLAVGRGLLSWLALGVAGFDLLSGVLIMMHWYAINK
ncbi:hypothetical protein NC796_00585 [Aliifodinibius sp. S!AR15-10]|uniref:hypothetical protein n=1 Tax=Aliifodinibius sp. S!AR15-10 TaxID=2950437 RepID=UPI0028548198|nr:hypothetical protein [Aliifodinibius sp. S!AR15-10]MDR8389610.1 hypothetical protein [Aliifodinibius sp. S!AR15-10]